MGNDVFCEYCKEEHATIYRGKDFICVDCECEAEQDEAELSYVRKRNEEISRWVRDQGEISLEEIMVKAYNEFIHFDDFGRVLDYYMKGKEPDLF